MPELPEIEALREHLLDRLRGHLIAGTAVRQFALVKTFAPPLDALIGESLVGIRRHGKHLLLDFSHDLTVAIHLSIGGRLVLAEPGRNPPRSVSLELTLEPPVALRVVELGTKKRSSLHVLSSSQVTDYLSGLGIDALDPALSVDRLAELIAAERSQLKSFLEDQHRIAGIGNAYSDEILWHARLAPLRLTTTLEAREISDLYAAISTVCNAAIERARQDNYLLLARGDERGSFQAHRRAGQPCPRCGDPIASIHFSENSLQYCPICQAGGRHYADRRLSRLLK
jgi:formamidopyrimidine-DNA glycosylase